MTFYVIVFLCWCINILLISLVVKKLKKLEKVNPIVFLIIIMFTTLLLFITILFIYLRTTVPTVITTAFPPDYTT